MLGGPRGVAAGGAVRAGEQPRGAGGGAGRAGRTGAGWVRVVVGAAGLAVIAAGGALR